MKRSTMPGCISPKPAPRICYRWTTSFFVPGQEPERSLAADLPQAHLIGGADVAAELDARRAIDQGTRLALTI